MRMATTINRIRAKAEVEAEATAEEVIKVEAMGEADPAKDKEEDKIQQLPHGTMAPMMGGHKKEVIVTKNGKTLAIPKGTRYTKSVKGWKWQ
jgi:hypothetical protein